MGKDTGLSSNAFSITGENQYYIDVMRGISILRVVLVHLGLSWFYPPYSQYVGIFLPVLFFVSGAVSYYSFARSKTIMEYLIKRVVLIVTPFYVFALLVMALQAIFFDKGWPEPMQVLRWVLLWPDLGAVFFPLGQIWFINALVVMIFLSLPLFKLSLKWSAVLWIGILGPLLLSLANLFLPLYDNFTTIPLLYDIGWAHQPWQTLLLFCVFCAGAMHYRFYQDISLKASGLMAAFFLLVSAGCFVAFDMDFELRDHVRNRSVYYLMLSFFAVYFLLSMRGVIFWIFGKIPLLEWLILYTNRYAYSVFLLHTLVLFCVERLFGWEDLGGQVALALLRMLVVVVITLLLAAPLGIVSKKIGSTIRELLLRKLNLH